MSREAHVPPPTDADAPPELHLSAQGGPDIPGPDDWRRGLTHKTLPSGDHVVEKTPGNLALLLSHHHDWAGCIRYDELRYSVVWGDMPPYIPGMAAPRGVLADEHFIYVQQAARRQWGVLWGLDTVAVALQAAAHAHSYHPVREYLDGLAWDGMERLTLWLQTYHNAATSEVPVGRWWAISAVARAYRPGAQVDHLLVLQGAQGAGKSSCLRLLAGDWYSGTLGDLRGVDGPQSLLGAWIVEMGELDALRGAASTRVKDFISQTSDHYRPSYGRCFVDRARQCVFAGTTNEHEYLHDSSGSRRFWPVSVGALDRGALERDRDQLWAEAVAAYRAGERWWPEGQLEAQSLSSETESRFAADPWEEHLQDYLEARMDHVTMSSCLKHLDVETGRQGVYDSRRVGAVMRRLGWDCQRTKTTRFWARKLNS